MGTFLIIMGVVVAMGVGAYYLLRQKPEEPQLPEAQPEPVAELPAPVIEPESEPMPESEPLVIMDPLVGEPLRADCDSIRVPLRQEHAPGFRAYKVLRVNNGTARDYRKFGIKFFRTSLDSMNHREFHCYYEEDDCIVPLELCVLFALMFGGDCTDENFEDRCDELEGFYDEDPLAYDNENAVRDFEMMGDDEYDIITDDDIIEEEEAFDDEVTEPNVDAAVVAAALASTQVPDEPKPVDEAVEAIAALTEDVDDEDEDDD